MRGFMLDGNFTAEQLKMKVPEDDVHLTDGDAFFTTRKPYYDHLKVAVEIREVCHMYAGRYIAPMNFIIETNVSRFQSYSQSKYAQAAFDTHGNRGSSVSSTWLFCSTLSCGFSQRRAVRSIVFQLCIHFLIQICVGQANEYGFLHQ
jgi:hypothetical protein